MSQPFVGQIIPVGFNFAPVGWLLCDGSSLSIAEYQVLFTLLGTTYGGNGQTTFNLPDLRGRGALGMGQGSGLQPYIQGQASGSENVTLVANQIAAHTHALNAASTTTSAVPLGTTVLGTPDAEFIYATSGASTTLASGSIGAAPGGSQPHENRQPFQVINYIIAFAGIFPSQG